MEGVNVDRSDPYVFGGVVVDGDGEMERRELEPAGHWYSEPLPPAPDQLEESVVLLGELRTAPLEERPGSMGGRLLKVVNRWFG